MFRHSKRFRLKHFGIVLRQGKNLAIVVIAGMFVEIIYTKLKKDEDFFYEIDALTERKMNSMRVRTENPLW